MSRILCHDAVSSRAEVRDSRILSACASHSQGPRDALSSPSFARASSVIPSMSYPVYYSLIFVF